MQRRSFLAAMLAASTAPAYVGSGVLMPVKKLILPPEKLLLPTVGVDFGGDAASVVHMMTLSGTLKVAPGDTVRLNTPFGLLEHNVLISQAVSRVVLDPTGQILKFL